MSKIDVRKCEFYNYNCNYCDCYKDSYGDYYHKCTDEELKNCYYRQLQQLKAENEELKDTVTCLRVELDKQKTRFKKHIAKLEQENEKLSTQNYYLDKANLGLAEENENYLQCLDEIERIANAIVYGTHFTNDIEGHLKELTKQILQLIKQAKEDE